MMGVREGGRERECFSLSLKIENNKQDNHRRPEDETLLAGIWEVYVSECELTLDQSGWTTM